jgi:hypothetical protein
MKTQPITKEHEAERNSSQNKSVWFPSDEEWDVWPMINLERNTDHWRSFYIFSFYCNC